MSGPDTVGPCAAALQETAGLLASVADVLSGRVVEPLAPEWAVRRGWDAFLLELDDASLREAEHRGAHRALVAVTGAPASLVALCEQVERLTAGLAADASREPVAAPLRRASPRKRAQVAALAALVRRALPRPERIVDLGAGHGHLTREVARELGVHALGIDRDAERVRVAAELTEAGGPRFAQADAVAESVAATAGDLVLGLHACGELGDALIQMAGDAGADVALVSCCLQKRSTEERRPLSRVGQRAGLVLKRELLGLTNLTPGPHGVEAPMDVIMEGQTVKHALTLLLRERGVRVEPGAGARGVGRRHFLRGLPHAAAIALRRRGLPPARPEELTAAWERARREHGIIRRLSLPRAMLGRVIEIAVSLDRAAALEEAGYRARVQPVFDAGHSPRNLGVLATLRWDRSCPGRSTTAT